MTTTVTAIAAPTSDTQQDTLELLLRDEEWVATEFAAIMTASHMWERLAVAILPGCPDGWVRWVGSRRSRPLRVGGAPVRDIRTPERSPPGGRAVCPVPGAHEASRHRTEERSQAKFEEDTMSPDPNPRFALRRMTSTDWVILDLSRPEYDPYRLVGRVYEVDDFEYDVLWLRDLNLQTCYMSPQDALRDLKRAHFATRPRPRRPVPIPHRPPLSEQVPPARDIRVR